MSVAVPEIHSSTLRMLSQYRRAEEAPVPVSQYSVTVSSTSSSEGGSSDQPISFSAIHAHRPAGESSSE